MTADIVNTERAGVPAQRPQRVAEVDETYGVSPAALCVEQLASRAAQVDKSVPDLAARCSAAPTRRRTCGAR